MRSCRLLVVVLSAALLTACLDSSVLVKVNADGSGTVEQTTLVNMAAMRAMMPDAKSPINTDEMQRSAERMGKGVRLVSAEPVKRGGFEGVKSLFAFDDINQIQVNQDPDLPGGLGDAKKDDNPVSFSLQKKGATSLLTIAFRDTPAGPAGADAKPSTDMPDLSDPMLMGMLKSMFQGFKVRIDLEVGGPIVKTNAEYVNGSTVTLVELDMGELMADEAGFKALQGQLGPNPSFSALKPHLKDVKGIKLDGPKVDIEFRQ